MKRSALAVVFLFVVAIGCQSEDGGTPADTTPSEEAGGKKEVVADPVKNEPSADPIVTSEIEYEADGVTMKGFLAYDQSREGKRPGVLVVHEWWGHNDYARDRAKKLAEMGYVAFALDMYGDGKQASHPKDAKAFSSAVFKNLDGAEKRFDAAMNVLKDQPSTDPESIAAIGYCFGGAIVIHMARQGAELDAVASFHGMLSPPKTKTEKGEVKAKMLIANGGADPMNKPKAIKGFKRDLKRAGVDFEFVDYEGALHAFTNPNATENGKKFGLPLAYDEKAAKDSWAKLEALLNDVFSSEAQGG